MFRQAQRQWPYFRTHRSRYCDSFGIMSVIVHDGDKDVEVRNRATQVYTIGESKLRLRKKVNKNAC